jgi:WD40 repeat protein
VLKIFSTSGWRQVAEKAHEHMITNVAFSPDARWLITTENDSDVGNANIMPTNSWKIAHLAHGKPISAISISPDGRWILTKTDPYCQRARLVPGEARVWRIADGEPQASVPLTERQGCSLDSQFVQGGPSGKIELVGDSANWTAIPLAVESPVKSADGQWSAEWDWGDSIKLNVVSGVDRKPITHRAGAVRNMVFSMDGRWLITASRDGVGRIWPLTREDMIVESCARLTHNLSEDDWHRYLDKEAYAPVCPGLPPLQK